MFNYFYSAKYILIKFTLNFFIHTPNADKWLVAGYRTYLQIANTRKINLRAPTAGVAVVALMRSSVIPLTGVHGTEGSLWFLEDLNP